jgi:hypothetical protein
MKLIPNDESNITETVLKATLKPMIKDEELLFEQVKDYIMAHPKATLIQIAEKNNTTPIKLLQWIREERLEFSEESESVWFECEKCGTKIRSGRLCNRCKISKA